MLVLPERSSAVVVASMSRCPLGPVRRRPAGRGLQQPNAAFDTTERRRRPHRRRLRGHAGALRGAARGGRPPRADGARAAPTRCRRSRSGSRSWCSSTSRCPGWMASRCCDGSARGAAEGPPVIMLTAARREPHAIEAGLREGADAYLTKPIDARELLARTRAALESFRLKRLLEGQRRDHIAMLVHDLRHPLSSLGLVAEVLDAEDLGGRRAPRGGREIRGLCKDMARLIDGVLAASRLEAGVFTVEPQAGHRRRRAQHVSRGLRADRHAPSRRRSRSRGRSNRASSPTRRSSGRRSTTSWRTR